MIVIPLEDVASAVTVLTGVAGYGGWMYRRGQAAGQAKAEIEARLARLERELGEPPPRIAPVDGAGPGW